ncbi:MAG: hypothetical protein J6R30_00285 [Bacteroidales bacterium]|nr:hypothetical protein [Bacteroidales bacterium]
MKERFILPIITVCILASCISRTDSMTALILDDVQTYMDEQPDSALTILQAIDTSSIATKKIEAKYALLLSQALDKNYIDLQSDSIIAPAVRYYDNHGSAEEKMKTLYYRGRIAMNAQKYEDAISYFTKAARYADKVCDKVAVGRVYAAQANIYNEYFDIEKTIKSAEMAAEYYLAGRDTIKYLNAIRMVTSQYLYQDSIKVAENLEITRSYWNNLNSQLKSYYYSNLLINSNTASRERIEEILETYFDEIRDSSKIRWFPVAEAYYTMGNLDKAMESLEIHKLYNRDSTSALYCHTYALVNDMAGNISEALDGYKGYFKATDRLHGFAYTSNVRFIEERYRNEIELYEARHQKERTALISIIGLLCTIIIIFLTLRKLNIRTIEKKQMEIEMLKFEQLYAEAEAEKEVLSQMLENASISSSTKNIIFKRLEILNTVVVSHLSSRNSDIRKAREKLDDLISDRDAFIQSTRMTIEESCPEFLRRLHSYGLDNDEIDICCLYAIGMKGKDIKAYTGQSRLYIQSAGIRHKLGLEESDTNLSIYIRDMYSAT